MWDRWAKSEQGFFRYLLIFNDGKQGASIRAAVPKLERARAADKLYAERRPYKILAFFFGSTTPASLVGSAGMGLPQYGHSPDVMPTLAATGCPQLGQVPIWTWGSLPATALGLKHMINLRSFRWAHAPAL